MSTKTKSRIVQKSVSLPVDLIEEVHKVALKEDRSFSKIVQYAVRNYLDLLGKR